MPEPANREEHEQTIASKIWDSWLGWSNTPSPQDLASGSLIESVKNSLWDTVEGIWKRGYEAVMSQFGASRVSRQEAIFFAIFFADLTDSLGSRWRSRVDQYLDDQRSDSPYRPRWEHVRGRGQKVQTYVPGMQRRSRDTAPSISGYGPTGVSDVVGGVYYDEWYDPDSGQYVWVSEHQDPSDPRKVIGGKPLVYPSDADSEGINWTTGANTFGEMFGVRQVESQGIARVHSLWQTERDRFVCPICNPLQGKPKFYWGRNFPDGPPAHPNCRCWLSHKNFLQ